jgi:peptide/nickel transport system ATP-binding protein
MERDHVGAASSDNQSLLSVRNLSVSYGRSHVATPAVADVTFEVRAGERVAIVGESGSGKTQSAMAVMGLLPHDAVVAGSVRFAGEELLTVSERDLTKIRGQGIGLIMQNAATALSPLRTIGSQIAEGLRLHLGQTKSEAKATALELLAQVGMADPERRAEQLPHELSGGMAQRALIAATVSLRPRLLIADEPTSSLDATTAKGVMELIATLGDEHGIAVLLITHDLGLVRDFAERAVVVSAGRVVEAAATRELFSGPRHEYTKSLLDSLPGGQNRRPHRSSQAPSTTSSESAGLELRGVTKQFGIKRTITGRGGTVHAVTDVDLVVKPGEVLAIVGESGSGKSTVGKLLLGLESPTRGTVLLDGDDITSRRSKAHRKRLGVVFQNPDGSLNPRLPIRKIVSESLDIHHVGTQPERRARVSELLAKVGLKSEDQERKPREFSGGQRQRIAIARALAVRPNLVVCDEAVTALDVQVQAQILDLLQDVQEQEGLGYVFISHDLAVVHQIADRIVVMYFGRIVEEAPAVAFFEGPRHPYSAALLASAHDGQTRSTDLVPTLAGSVPSQFDPPAGCAFHTRCWRATELCRSVRPELVDVGAGDAIACHHPLGQDSDDVAADDTAGAT